jgi:transcriptional antiterminator NusG
MSTDTAKHKIDFAVGEPVVVADGPFKDLEGRIGEIDEDKGKVKVLVSMFGRETPVELFFHTPVGLDTCKYPIFFG